MCWEKYSEMAALQICDALGGRHIEYRVFKKQDVRPFRAQTGALCL
jgi:hypothetical protein